MSCHRNCRRGALLLHQSSCHHRWSCEEATTTRERTDGHLRPILPSLLHASVGDGNAAAARYDRETWCGRGGWRWHHSTWDNDNGQTQWEETVRCFTSDCTSKSCSTIRPTLWRSSPAHPSSTLSTSFGPPPMPPFVAYWPVAPSQTTWRHRCLGAPIEGHHSGWTPWPPCYIAF